MNTIIVDQPEAKRRVPEVGEAFQFCQGSVQMRLRDDIGQALDLGDKSLVFFGIDLFTCGVTVWKRATAESDPDFRILKPKGGQLEFVVAQ